MKWGIYGGDWALWGDCPAQYGLAAYLRETKFYIMIDVWTRDEKKVLRKRRSKRKHTIEQAKEFAEQLAKLEGWS